MGNLPSHVLQIVRPWIDKSNFMRRNISALTAVHNYPYVYTFSSLESRIRYQQINAKSTNAMQHIFQRTYISCSLSLHLLPLVFLFLILRLFLICIRTRFPLPFLHSLWLGMFCAGLISIRMIVIMLRLSSWAIVLWIRTIRRRRRTFLGRRFAKLFRFVIYTAYYY